MLLNVLGFITTHREIVIEMAKRDLKEKNKGALLGHLWVVINPLIQVAVYVVVVSFIFKVRLNNSSGPLHYTLYVLSGMIPWQIITKSLQDAPSVIRDRMELVKQVVYPIETLPLTGLLVGSFGSFISFLLFLMLSAAIGALKWSIVLMPIPFVLLVLFVLGVSWAFSIIGIILKDLREIISVFLSLMVYVSPVILNESAVSPGIWKLIMINPLSHIIICFRDIFQATFHVWSWIIFVGVSLGFFILGGWIITKTKILINEYI